MKFVLIIAVGTLSRFVSSGRLSVSDTHSRPKMRTVLTRMDHHYACPSYQRKSPEISLSPFQVTSDAQHVVGSGMRPEQTLTIIPVSVKAFSKLGLMLGVLRPGSTTLTCLHVCLAVLPKIA